MQYHLRIATFHRQLLFEVRLLGRKSQQLFRSFRKHPTGDFELESHFFLIRMEPMCSQRVNAYDLY